MKKEETIERFGEAAYEKQLGQHRVWHEEHPEEVLASNREANRKGGKRYEKNLIYQRTGLRGARNSIRTNHAMQYRPFKKIIAPDSQIHHQWVPETSEYTGVALVEANQHMHGFIDVIEILEGKINVFTEKEIRIQ